MSFISQLILFLDMERNVSELERIYFNGSFFCIFVISVQQYFSVMSHKAVQVEDSCYSLCEFR